MKELDEILSPKNINGLKMYDARALKEIIGIKKKYADWIKTKLIIYDKVIQKDKIEKYFLNKKLMCYSYGVKAQQGVGAKREYYITYDCLCDIIHRSSKTPNLKPILDIIGNNNVVLKNRAEIEFIETLKEIFSPLNIAIKEQYLVESYRIDAYIEKYNIAIEFDETYHNYQKDKDEEREQFIKNQLNCTFVRCSDKNSINYNIGLVIKQIFENIEI